MNEHAAGRYKMGTLSRRTGLKPELLRAWQRRYGLFEPERTEGGHRLYTDDDLRVALYLRDLIARGRSVGELAQRGRATLLGEAREAVSQLPSAAGPSVPPPLTETQARVLCEAIVQGAVSIDAEALTVALDRATASLSAEEFISWIVSPASSRIGDLWADAECSVAGEHLVSSMLRDRLLRFLEKTRPPRGRTSNEVVVACAPDDFHENGALVTAVRLAALGWHVLWLGAATPVDELDKACRRLRPHAVYVSCTMPEAYTRAREELLAFARRWQGAFEIVIGGQGAPEADGELTATGARVSIRWSAPVTEVGPAQ